MKQVKGKKIKELLKEAGDHGVLELETKTIIQVRGGTVHLTTYIMQPHGVYGQAISRMKDQPLAVLNRTQISTQ